ncbi:hypothetical protein PaecuDRAFT_3882 [Paenibacillus curdlanolyticus YK9]|uniref:Uncharacterized protein n=1 Tax=Paenibacillus curdlanolyticus YK9 TaxID=717606 RepID=E0IDZ1_9BACL|nr:hypothetical protein PaecuDRAFT_3882 [Paenibacillus curdlanolyticus YK9]
MAASVFMVAMRKDFLENGRRTQGSSRERVLLLASASTEPLQLVVPRVTGVNRLSGASHEQRYCANEHVRNVGGTTGDQHKSLVPD